MNKALSLIVFIVLNLTIYTCNRSSELPEVETVAVENIASISATVSGRVTGNDDDIISRGICYSTQPNPTINNEQFDGGQGNGDFEVYLFNLQKVTTYYVRAFASTEKETYYGNELNFTTTEHIGVNINGTVYYTHETANLGQIPWGPDGFTGYTGTTDGQKNTENIAAIGEEFAARKCADLVLENYDNWFLPAADEWTQIEQHFQEFGSLNFVVDYWTSTDLEKDSAIIFNRLNGLKTSVKTNQQRCQCFRKSE